MFFTSGSAKILDQLETENDKAGIGVSCKVVCPGCYSSYTAVSKLYAPSDDEVASLATAVRDISRIQQCEVCGLSSVMPSAHTSSFVRELTRAAKRERFIPRGKMAPWARKSLVLVDKHGKTEVTEHYHALGNYGPVLKIVLERGMAGFIPVARLSRVVVCSACELRIERTVQQSLCSADGKPREFLHEATRLEGIADTLSKKMSVPQVCEYCGAFEGLSVTKTDFLKIYLVSQLSPRRVSARVEALRKEHRRHITKERKRLHDELATECHRLTALQGEKPKQTCWPRTHSDQLVWMLRQVQR